MPFSKRRPPLAKGRRIPLNVNLSPVIARELKRIGSGNRSAAIEQLVEDHLARTRALTPEPVT